MTDRKETNDQIVKKLGKMSQRGSELETTEAQLLGTEKLLELAPVMFLALNLEGEVTVINKTGETLLGLPRDQIVGKKWIDNFLPERDRDRVKALFFKVLAGETTVTQVFENPVLTGNGEERLIAWNNTVLKSETGEAVGTLSSGVDITEQRRAEEEMLKEKNFSTLILDSLPGTFYLFDSQGKIISWNSFLERASGYSSEEIRTMHVLDFFPDDEKPKLQQAVEEVFTKGETYVEAEWKTRSGKRIPYYFSARRIYSNGRPYLIGVGIDITERKRVERALEESEKKYRNIFENALEGIFRTTPDGRLISANTAFARLIGYASTEEMINEVTDIGRQIYVKPEDRQALKRNLEEDSGPLEGVEIECRRKDGAHIWVSLNAWAVRDTKGKIICYEGTCGDITARKLAQDRLRESEQRYRLLAENSLVGVYMHSEGNFVYANRRLAEMLGYTTEDLMQKKFWEIVHPEHREDIKAKGLGTYKGAEVPSQYECKVICRNGETKWVEVSAVRVTHQGQAAVLGAFIDITEKKNAMDALTKSEALMKAILNGITTNIAFVNKDMEIMWVNKAAADSISQLPSQMIGRKCHELWADPDKPCEECPTAMAFRTRNSHHLEMVTPDGRVWDERGEPVFDAQGQLIGVVEIAQDITERKKADEERESLRAQLFQAQKMEAVGTLAGGIAHDFNNLLTVVLGFAEVLLLQKDRDHPDHADLQKICHAARNGADLVQRLLTLGRKAEPRPVPMNLNRLVLRVEKLLRRTIPKMIYFQSVLSDEAPEINADPSQMEQVLINLAVNARDAMPNGGSLTVKTDKVLLDDVYCDLHVEARPGEYALLTVTDTGCGMDKETLGHMFEPFFTTKEMGRGTGLGLAMVYGIVNRHNGHITCHSEIGHGTTFKIYLPAIPTEQATDDETSGRVLALGRETVLLVDDEQFVRDLGARILTRFGYTVLQAANGKEAIEVFKRERDRISLVILDLIMPEMGGKECLAAILKMNPRMKVIVASGYSTSACESAAMGAQGFIDKPFRVKDLLQEVRRVLDKH